MNTMESTDGSKKQLNVAAWIHRGWRFIAVPLLWLIAWFIGNYFALAWLIILGIYIALISAIGIINIPDQLNLSRKQMRMKRLFNVLGPFAWGGFLALLYWLTYVLIFHFEDLNVG
jgi:hypothetical protein